MGQMNIPSQPTYRFTKYEKLRGVDFSRDITEVDLKRTPDGLNLISDNGGNPVKRLGWRKDTQLNCGKIKKIMFHNDMEDEENDPLKKYIIANNGLYVIYYKNGVKATKQIVSATSVDNADIFLFDDVVYAFLNNKLYKMKGLEAIDLLAGIGGKIYTWKKYEIVTLTNPTFTVTESDMTVEHPTFKITAEDFDPSKVDINFFVGFSEPTDGWSIEKSGETVKLIGSGTLSSGINADLTYDASTATFTMSVSGVIIPSEDKVFTVASAKIYEYLKDVDSDSETAYPEDGEQDGYYYKRDVEIKEKEDAPYIPEVSISRNPDGTGGASLEGVNLLTPKRTYSFLGNANDKEYNLVPEANQENDYYKYIISDSIKIEARDENGEYQELKLDTDYKIGTVTQIYGRDVLGVTKQFNVCEPKVTFTAVHKPVVTGQDNVKITFENFDATEDHKETINEKEETVYVGQYKESRVDLLKTSITKTYGYITTDRVFAVGGKNKNRIYYSGVNDPTYWPDNNYIVTGQDGNDIVGLHTYSEYLVAIKGDSNAETTIYYIYGAQYENNTYFSVRPTLGGTGAISKGSFAMLGDEPLFLSRTGVFAISTSWGSTENILRNRSYFVDKRLVEESNLEDSVAVVWRRYYILCVNEHCYILDGRNTAKDSNNTTNYNYEAYYWENIPATAFYNYESELWFGTADGHLCKFNTDIDNRTAYCDDGVLTQNDDGVYSMTGGTAIVCRWSTPLDDDNTPQFYKTLNKKGSMLTVLPYTRTSASVTLNADGNRRYQLGIFYADIFDWELIDFSRFTFNANDTAQDQFFNKKVKKYKRLQIIIENNESYEPFGILQIIKTYTVGNFAKNRG